MPRIRTRVHPNTSPGSMQTTLIQWNAGSVYQTTPYSPVIDQVYPGGQDQCNDEVSTSLPYPDHPLDLSKIKVRPGRFNGTYLYPASPPFSGNQYQITMSDHYVQRIGDYRSAGVPNLPSINWTLLMTSAIANVNPNRPALDLPLFLFELKDFPRMLRDLGRVLQKKVRPSDVPGGHLAYSFGWAPLLRDLRSLLDLESSLRRHLNNLRSVRNGKRIRRSLGTLDKSRVRTTTKSPITSNGSYTLWVDCLYDLKQESWFTAHIVTPDAAAIDALLADDRSGQIRHLLGLRPSQIGAATLWDMIPWSWLIDYFANVGSFLEARRGSIPFRLERLNIMTHQKITEYSEVNPSSSSIYRKLSYVSHKFEKEYKGRRFYIAPTARLTFKAGLTNGQKSILASLVTARLLRAGGS